MSMTNGGPEPQMEMPQIGIMTQYVKDFSFENPNAPRSMAPSTQGPAINIQIAVDAAPLTDTDFEVALRLEAKAESQGLLLFGFELVYCGVFSLRTCRAIACSRWCSSSAHACCFRLRAKSSLRRRAMAGFRRSCLSRWTSSLFTVSAWPQRSRHRRRRRSIQADVITPDRTLAERRDKAAMRRAFFSAQPHR